MTTPNFQNLTDEQLLQAAQIKGIDVSDIAPQTQKRQELEQLSDEQLLQLSQQQQQPLTFREKAADFLFPGERQKRTPVKDETLADFLFGTEQTGFEEGLGFGLRDIAIPALTAVPELFQGFREAGQSIGDFILTKAGLPPLKETEEKLGIKTGEFPFTQEKIQKKFDELTNNEFKDSPELFKTAGEIVKDAELFMIPLAGKGMPFFKAIGTSAFGNLGAKGLVNKGIIDEKNKDLTKIGLFLSTSFLNPNKIRDAATGFYNKARDAVKGIITTDNVFASEMGGLRNSLARSGGEVLKKNKPALEFIDAVLPEIKDGTFEASKIPETVRNLNDLITEVGIETKAGRQLTKIRSVLQNAAERIGKNNPNFIKNWNEANSLWSSLNSKDVVSSFFRNKIPQSVKNLLPDSIRTIFDVSNKAFFKPIDLPINFFRKFSNPAVVRFYGNFIKNAVADNASAAASNLQKMAKELEKEKQKK